MTVSINECRHRASLRRSGDAPEGVRECERAYGALGDDQYRWFACRDDTGVSPIVGTAPGLAMY
ncbi:hypothetical protein [Mycolicibacterium porcinum]|uniref:Uncharacterized protein n=1 Tax=Mycolicibacterium porcinum TaxID=39693 RepID=A0ABV3VN43_9MYCO